MNLWGVEKSRKHIGRLARQLARGRDDMTEVQARSLISMELDEYESEQLTNQASSQFMVF
jgi:hypothetical protein